jgi:hypothetical protein
MTPTDSERIIMLRAEVTALEVENTILRNNVQWRHDHIIRLESIIKRHLFSDICALVLIILLATLAAFK